MNQLESAETSLEVLQRVLRDVSADDLAAQTPCREFDVAALTDHLMNSITVIGESAGAQLPERDRDAPVERQVGAAARSTLDAWKKRGLDGTVSFGPNQTPAAVMAGILSLEFLVHAWDYAAATGRQVAAPEEVAEYVLDQVRSIITPQGRARAGFDDPIEISEDASALDRLLAFTGRRPTG
jgi:uncharacterized protein (TIGR03086 family)